ncbi:MAG: hypothetical protein ACR2MN_14310 [Acidimicrobiales bacterium]
MSFPWEAIDGGAGGLARRDEMKPDGRRLTLYRLGSGEAVREDRDGTGASDETDAGRERHP